MQSRLVLSLLGLALASACTAAPVTQLSPGSVSGPVSGPAVDLEPGVGVRALHARLLPGEQALEVELRTPFVSVPSRRQITVEGVASDGRVLFTRETSARTGPVDARYHRESRARARIELPELSDVAGLRVRTGR